MAGAVRRACLRTRHCYTLANSSWARSNTDGHIDVPASGSSPSSGGCFQATATAISRYSCLMVSKFIKVWSGGYYRAPAATICHLPRIYSCCRRYMSLVTLVTVTRAFLRIQRRPRLRPTRRSPRPSSWPSSDSTPRYRLSKDSICIEV